MNVSAVAVCRLVAAALVSVWIAWPAYAADQNPPDDGKLRIICFGAHPDDCEISRGGSAACGPPRE